MTEPRSAFRIAAEHKDLDALMATLTSDVVLNSPAKFSPFRGADEVRMVLGMILTVLEDFRYTDEVHGDGVTALIFRAHVGEREVEGLDLLRFGPDGLVYDLTVMMRPKSALDAVIDEMTVRLGAAGS
jgi:hypothetical protein